MASSTRTRRPAQKRPPAAKKAPARKPAPRKRAPAKKPAQPLMTPRQAADLGGLLLGALACFGVLVLWFGWDGAFLGNLIDGVLRDLVGRVAVLVPPLAALGAALLFSHGSRPRLRPGDGRRRPDRARAADPAVRRPDATSMSPATTAASSAPRCTAPSRPPWASRAC